MNFNHNCYNTNFRYKFGETDKWFVRNQAACFGQLFSDLSQIKNKMYFRKKGIEVVISLSKDPKAYHFCPSTEEEVHMLLQETQQWIDFEYTYIDFENHFDIAFITNASAGTIKVLLTLIRLLYESPYSICMKEALMMHKYGFYPNLPIIYKYHLAQTALSSCTFGTDHAFYKQYFRRRYLIESIEELKLRAADYKDSSRAVNEFFQYKEVVETNPCIIKSDRANSIYLINGELNISLEAVTERVKEIHENDFKYIFYVPED